MKPSNYETSFFVGQSLNVLVVEESHADADLALRALRHYGYRVQSKVITTPEQFAEEISTKDYSVVLCDFNLTGWTGLEALELLANLKRRVPFVLVAGPLAEDVLGSLIDQGLDDYVLKGDWPRLPLAVRRVLREHRLIAEITKSTEEQKQLNARLQETLVEVKRLQGLLPICISCKRVRNVEGFWNRIEHYIERHSDAQISPCLCPSCSSQQDLQNRN